MGPESVSYTHLDVYKRQLHRQQVPVPLFRPVKAVVSAAFQSSVPGQGFAAERAPVSYTHLDVYKRQIFMSSKHNHDTAEVKYQKNVPCWALQAHVRAMNRAS